MPTQGAASSPRLTPRALRVEIAKRWDRPLYQLASAVPIHPVTFSAILNGRLPLNPRLAMRILQLLAEKGEVHGH